MRRWIYTAVAVAGVAGVAGCRSTSGDDGDGRGRAVVVTVDADGRLRSQGFVLTAADLPTFAAETGSRPVVLIPRNSPDYGRAVRAKANLQAAGVRNVTIGGDAGE